MYDETNTLRMLKNWDWPKFPILGADQRIAASGDENEDMAAGHGGKMTAQAGGDGCHGNKLA